MYVHVCVCSSHVMLTVAKRIDDKSNQEPRYNKQVHSFVVGRKHKNKIQLFTTPPRFSLVGKWVKESIMYQYYGKQCSILKG